MLLSKSLLSLRLFSLSIAVLVSIKSHGQQAPMVFGKVDKSLLEMKVYDKDTSAEAVIICDYGRFSNVDYNFTRLYRLKVLKKSGCDRANFIMHSQSKSGFNACTYNLINDEIIKEKLKNESIFEEMITKSYYRYRLTMPNVQVGSVIDIQVNFRGIPYDWFFQSDIPVMWSELRLPNVSNLGIQKNYFGFEPLTISEDDRWVCKDMPALKKEPFMNDLVNFLTKFQIDLTSAFGYDFASSWSEANLLLLHNSTFGDALKTVFFMNSEAKSIADTCKTIQSKMITAYETIRNRIKWNEEEFLFPEYEIKYSINKGSGDAGAVNIALLLLLRKLDIECYPVVLSTRDNGMLPLIAPTIHKLNYMVVLAKIDSKDVLLDATEDFLPAGYLPERCINGNGHLVTESAGIPIELRPGGKNKTRLYSDLSLSEQGTFSGNLYYTYYDYAGYLFRKKYATFNDNKEFVRSFERENPGIHILNSSFKGLDSIYQPLNLKYTVENYGNTDVTDSTISFLPFQVERIDVNPFKSDTRRVPVDFIYQNEKKFILKIKIPDNYEVTHLPESVNLALPNNGGRFTFSTTAQFGVVIVQSELDLNRAVYTQDEYPFIKQLYAEIVNKQSEPVIIKKK
jgi:hypothetical protein